MSTRAFLLALAALLLLTGSGAAAGFIEQPQFGTGSTIAVAWGDADQDGDLDLAVGNYFGQSRELYVSNGDGTFTRQTPFGTGNTFAVVWADCDNDGDLDLSAGNGASQQSRLYVNNGGGAFAGQNQFGARTTVSHAWADYDLDGDLDLAVGNGILGLDQQNYLYINNGDGTFAEQAQFGALQTDSIVWADYDRDGDPDLAVGNGGFGSSQQNYLYINNGDGTFTGLPEFGLGDTACLDWGDSDNDGDLDLAVGNWNNTQCRLYINNGDGTFAGQDQFGAHDTNTLAWGDADLDGDLDLATGNGDFSSAEQNYLYVNGGGTFTETPEFGLGSTDGVAWADYDRDGDLDLAVGNEHTPTQNYLYVNTASPGSWLALHLIGHFHDLGSGYSNRDGIGAKVLVYEPGFLGVPGHLLGFREVEAHGGFASQSAIDPHFGLPGRAAVDVRIAWPGSGGSRVVQDLVGVSTGQRLTVHEQGTPAGVDEPRDAVGPRRGSLRVAPNPARGRAGFDLLLPGGGSARLQIYDAGGRLVRTLPLEPAGTVGEFRADWDRRGGDGRAVPAGVYFARVGGGNAGGGRAGDARAGEASAGTARLVLVR